MAGVSECYREPRSCLLLKFRSLPPRPSCRCCQAPVSTDEDQSDLKLNSSYHTRRLDCRSASASGRTKSLSSEAWEMKTSWGLPPMVRGTCKSNRCANSAFSCQVSPTLCRASPWRCRACASLRYASEGDALRAAKSLVVLSHDRPAIWQVSLATSGAVVSLRVHLRRRSPP
jgi:hypothetical protein